MYQPYQPRPPQRPVWPWILLGGAVVAIALVALFLYLGPYSNPAPGGRGYYFPYFGGFFLIFLFVWIAFFALRMAIWRGYRARYHGGQGPGGPRRDPAVMAARQRYARGEISREQYDQIITDLTRRRSGP